VFAINQLDAERLRAGLDALGVDDPARAQRVRERSLASVANLSPAFPGDLQTGVLDESEGAQARFEEFGNEEPCPALDPETGMCDLYSARPMTCRTFGPPVRSEGGLGVCELCYQGASDEQIAGCEMRVPAEEEAEVLAGLENATSVSGRTIVAFALAK
jgi:Fe-S-cluster containining protein